MSGPVVTNHTSLKTAENTMQHGTLRTDRCPNIFNRLFLCDNKYISQHRYRKTQCIMILSQVQQPCDVAAHAVEYWETSCTVPNNQKKKIRTSIQYRESCCEICQNGRKISMKVFWTKECRDQGIHPQSLLVKQIRNFQEKSFRANTVLFNYFAKDRNRRSLQENQDYKGSLQKTHW